MTKSLGNPNLFSKLHHLDSLVAEAGRYRLNGFVWKCGTPRYPDGCEDPMISPFLAIYEGKSMWILFPWTTSDHTSHGVVFARKIPLKESKDISYRTLCIIFLLWNPIVWETHAIYHYHLKVVCINQQICIYIYMYIYIYLYVCIYVYTHNGDDLGLVSCCDETSQAPGLLVSSPQLGNIASTDSRNCSPWWSWAQQDWAAPGWYPKTACYPYFYVAKTITINVGCINHSHMGGIVLI